MQNHSYVLLNSKERTDLLQRLNQRLCVFDAVVDATGCTVGRIYTEMAVHRLRTMVTDTDGDALRIDELADVMRVNAFDFESNRTDTLLVGMRSKNAYTLDLPHLEQFSCDNAFVGFKVFHANVH